MERCADSPRGKGGGAVKATIVALVIFVPWSALLIYTVTRYLRWKRSQALGPIAIGVDCAPKLHVAYQKPCAFSGNSHQRRKQRRAAKRERIERLEDVLWPGQSL